MTVGALRGHRPEVLDDLLQRYGREIQGVAYLILRDRAAAEDVVVDTLLTALERGDQLRDPEKLRPWLLRIATNRALGVRRSSSRVVLVAATHASVEVEAPPDTAWRPAAVPRDREAVSRRSNAPGWDQWPPDGIVGPVANTDGSTRCSRQVPRGRTDGPASTVAGRRHVDRSLDHERTLDAEHDRAPAQWAGNAGTRERSRRVVVRRSVRPATRG